MHGGKDAVEPFGAETLGGEEAHSKPRFEEDEEMTRGGRFRRGVWPLLLAVGALGLFAASARAETREFLIVTGEPSWEAKPGEAPVVDRDRGPVKKMERYTFHPGLLVVNRGDKVVLKIHDIKGDKHIIEVPAFKTGETQILRGEEKTVTFVADKAGIFEIKCNNHVDSKKEGPMVMYLSVMDKR